MLLHSNYYAIVTSVSYLIDDIVVSDLTIDDQNPPANPEENMKRKWMLIPALLTLTMAGAIAGAPPTGEIDGATRSEVIDALVARLNANYVFPDKAKQAEAVLRQRQREGKYDGITDGKQLAKQLSEDIEGVVHDKHMQVDFSARPVPSEESMPPPPQTRAEWEKQVPPAVRERVRASNLGIEKVDRLAPNIGYLQISMFGPVFLVSEKIASSMNALADTDGLRFCRVVDQTAEIGRKRSCAPHTGRTTPAIAENWSANDIASAPSISN